MFKSSFAGLLAASLLAASAPPSLSLRLTGQINQNRTVTLQPRCQPEDQRRERNGCRAVSFYFIPPEGRYKRFIRFLRLLACGDRPHQRVRSARGAGWIR